MATLSIIIPAYNEENTMLSILDRVKKVQLINGVGKEIIIVDDGSTDETRNILLNLDQEKYKVIFHEKNSGKGRAIRTGLEHATGDYVIIQDADLEYNPQDWNILLNKTLEGNPVVYGSRALKKNKESYKLALYANIFLSLLTSVLYDCKITDMETCYKLFSHDVIKNIKLNALKFDFEPEVTSKILKKGVNIVEVPINYNPRTIEEGKKINWKDGIQALWTLIKYRFID